MLRRALGRQPLFYLFYLVYGNCQGGDAAGHKRVYGNLVYMSSSLLDTTLATMYWPHVFLNHSHRIQSQAVLREGTTFHQYIVASIVSNKELDI